MLLKFSLGPICINGNLEESQRVFQGTFFSSFLRHKSLKGNWARRAMGSEKSEKWGVFATRPPSISLSVLHLLFGFWRFEKCGPVFAPWSHLNIERVEVLNQRQLKTITRQCSPSQTILKKPTFDSLATRQHGFSLPRGPQCPERGWNWNFEWHQAKALKNGIHSPTRHEIIIPGNKPHG